MSRRVLMVAVGAVLLVAASAGAAGAAPGRTPLPAGPPVAIPPGSPATAAVTGAPVNGVQLSMVAPKQLPLELGNATTALAPREVDVTVKDLGGAGYTGTVSTSFTEEAAGGVTGFLASVQRFDAASGVWNRLPAPAGTQPTLQDDAPVTVPAGGQAVERYRVGAGSNGFDDLKLVSSANGANVTATIPVTKPTLDVTGLPGSIHAGVPYPVTATLTNPTDLDYSGVDVEFMVQGCDTIRQGCFLAKDSKLEIQSGGAWKPVVLQDLRQVPGFSGFPIQNGALPHGGTLSVSMRLTLPINNLQVNPMHLAMTPNITGQKSAQATLIAAPMPSAATRTPQASAPATPQDSASASPSVPASASTSDTPTASDSAATADSPTPSVSLNIDPAASSSSGSGSNPTVLLAFGLLVLCGGLVGGYFYLQRRGRA